jgi:hypothetical protein
LRVAQFSKIFFLPKRKQFRIIGICMSEYNPADLDGMPVRQAYERLHPLAYAHKRDSQGKGTGFYRLLNSVWTVSVPPSAPAGALVVSQLPRMHVNDQSIESQAISVDQLAFRPTNDGLEVSHYAGCKAVVSDMVSRTLPEYLAYRKGMSKGSAAKHTAYVPDGMTIGELYDQHTAASSMIAAALHLDTDDRYVTSLASEKQLKDGQYWADSLYTLASIAAKRWTQPKTFEALPGPNKHTVRSYRPVGEVALFMAIDTIDSPQGWLDQAVADEVRPPSPFADRLGSHETSFGMVFKSGGMMTSLLLHGNQPLVEGYQGSKEEQTHHLFLPPSHQLHMDRLSGRLYPLENPEIQQFYERFRTGI